MWHDSKLENPNRELKDRWETVGTGAVEDDSKLENPNRELKATIFTGLQIFFS